jgi:signal transduction histidine kinase
MTAEVGVRHPHEPRESDEVFDEDRQLQRFQRMAMLGTLAGGLGHDLRNLVMPALLRLDVLAASADLSDAAKRDLLGIRTSIVRLQRLAGGLRLLATDPFDQHDETQFTILPEWWADIHPIVVDALPPNAFLEIAMPPDLPVAAVPPGMLAQIMINLVMNARRAMDATSRPRLAVKALAVGRDLRIDITDNGRGMDAETRRRCFEPFFTTRPREFATGLGLSTGRALMQRYGGDLWITSASEDGATFSLRIPVAHRHRDLPPVGSRLVRLEVRDPRQRAVVRLVMSQRGWREAGTDEAADAQMLVCDADTLASISLPSSGHQWRIIAIGQPATAAPPTDGIRWVDPLDMSGLGELLA